MWHFDNDFFNMELRAGGKQTNKGVMNLGYRIYLLTRVSKGLSQRKAACGHP